MNISSSQSTEPECFVEENCDQSVLYKLSAFSAFSQFALVVRFSELKYQWYIYKNTHFENQLNFVRTLR